MTRDIVRVTGRRLLLGLGFVAVTFAITGADWPQYRGPNRDNKIADFTAPEAWPKTFTQKWKVSVGNGVASPVLVGDKVYTFTRKGDEEVIYCLKASDGSEVWNYKYAAEPVTGNAKGFPGPRATPAVGDGKVCTLGVGGVVSCLDAETGKKVWQHETKAKPRFFTSSSPVIVDGLCIAHVGGDGRGELTAYDLKTGDTKWKWSATGDGATYGSPVIATLHGVKQVVTTTDKNVIGIALADGKLLWKVSVSPAPPRYQTATPVIDGETVICAGIAHSILKEGDTFITKQAWKGTIPHNYNTPVLKDGLLYGLTGQGRSTTLFCADAKTGKTLWTDSTQHGQCGEILDAGSVLILLSSSSQLIVFKPGKDSYMEVAKIKVADSETWAYPIVDGKRVFVKDSDSVISWAME